MFQDKTLLITGGTGSFGNAVLDRFINTSIKEIRIFSRDEKKQEDIRHKYNIPKIKYYIGDVRDRSSVDGAMIGVDYVFHAAALKQVPSCEFFPMEAVKTNIIGCENVLQSAIEHKVMKVVVLSTDKACYPINSMGMTKALSEKVMIAKSRDSQYTILCGTRYGNVMRSRGSVIPLFEAQIKAGKRLTITDPDMTRFMMTMDDAIDLVLYAFEHGVNGEMFVKKSPACTIRTLAQSLYKLHSIQYAKPIDWGMDCIGTRHGEKLFETLVPQEEIRLAIDEGGYYRIPSDNRDLNYQQYFTDGERRMARQPYTSHNTTRLDIDGVVALLQKTLKQAIF